MYESHMWLQNAELSVLVSSRHTSLSYYIENVNNKWLVSHFQSYIKLRLLERVWQQGLI